jgi:hypothetical protein
VIVKALLNRVFSAQETAFAYNPRALPEAKVSRADWRSIDDEPRKGLCNSDDVIRAWVAV